MIPSRPDDRQNRPPAPTPPGKPVWGRLVVVVLIVIGIVGLLAVAFPSQFKHQLNISVARQPTPYTQLFFAEPQALPKNLVAGHVNNFAFTVVNNEGHAETYHYTVTITGAKVKKVASAGTMTLGDEQTSSQTVGVQPLAHGTQYLIEVSLAGTADFIQFYGKTPKLTK